LGTRAARERAASAPQRPPARAWDANAQLSAAQQQAFDAQGFLTVPGALAPPEVAALTAAADAAVARRADLRGDTYTNTNGGRVARRSEVAQDPAFRRLVALSPTVPLVVQLLSPNIHLHTAAVIYKRPEVADGVLEHVRGWHRDIGMTEDVGHAGAIRAGIKVGYCLTDFGRPRSGFTLFAAGSHLLRRPLPLRPGAVDPDGVVELRLAAGDAFLFENRLFHTAAANLSDRTSKVVIFGYSYRWMGGSADDPALINSALLGDAALRQGLGPIESQLLCGRSGAQGGAALASWAAHHGVERPPFVWTEETARL
jgi:ectoine hydroxylase-related dioxygenase (phytanoyl-CoA dioxygenase family)